MEVATILEEMFAVTRIAVCARSFRPGGTSNSLALLKLDPLVVGEIPTTCRGTSAPRRLASGCDRPRTYLTALEGGPVV